MNLNKNIISQGIRNLVEDNDILFKQNLIYVLSNKLNDCIQDISKNCQKNLLNPKEQNTNITENINQFIGFIESHKDHKNDRLILKDNCVINIKESEIKNLKMLFENLNTKNREKMSEKIFKNAENLKNHIKFYGQVKELL